MPDCFTLRISLKINHKRIKLEERGSIPASGQYFPLSQECLTGWYAKNYAANVIRHPHSGNNNYQSFKKEKGIYEKYFLLTNGAVLSGTQLNYQITKLITLRNLNTITASVLSLSQID